MCTTLMQPVAGIRKLKLLCLSTGWLMLLHTLLSLRSLFDIPRSIIHNTHRMLLRQTIHLPWGDQFEEVGTRFSHLAGFNVFNVVGRAKPPCYLNRRLFAYSCRPSVTIRAGFGTLLLDSQAEYGILLCWIKALIISDGSTHEKGGWFY